MTDTNYTHLTLVVDRSGSMSATQQEAQNGINELFKEQREVPGKFTVTLVDFDTEHRVIQSGADIHQIPDYVLEPRGMTALLDAVGKAINETGAVLRNKAERKRPGNVIFCVVTDGGENSSREFTQEKIQEMVKEQTDRYGWHFQYIGPDVNGWAGRAMGFANNSQYVPTGSGTTNAYAAFTVATTDSRNSTAATGASQYVGTQTVIPEDGE